MGKFKDYLLSEKFYTGLRAEGLYFEFYKNPVPSELKDMRKSFFDANGEDDWMFDLKDGTPIRGFFDDKNNLYVWVAQLLHDDAQKKLRLKNVWGRFEHTLGKGKKEFAPSDMDFDEYPDEYFDRMEVAFPDIKL